MIWILKGVVAIFASGQIVETLRHGSNFRWLRRWGNRNVGNPGLIRIPAKLSFCAFCQSHWSPVLPLFVLFRQDLPSNPIAAVAILAVASLAVTRATQLLNDLTHHWNRSPPPDEEIEDDQTDVVDAAA